MALSEGTISIISFLKENNNRRYTNAQLATELGRGGRSISGSVRSLINKGLVDSEDAVVEVEGKEKAVKTYGITSAGMDFDPAAPVSAE